MPPSWKEPVTVLVWVPIEAGETTTNEVASPAGWVAGLSDVAAASLVPSPFAS